MEENKEKSTTESAEETKYKAPINNDEEKEEIKEIMISRFVEKIDIILSLIVALKNEDAINEIKNLDSKTLSLLSPITDKSSNF